MEYRRVFKSRKVITLYMTFLVIALGIYIYQQVYSVSAERTISGNAGEIAAGEGTMPYEEFQARYALAYQEYLQKILAQSDDLAGISIFRQVDSYSFRNLEKTRSDYEALVGLKTTEGNFKALETVVGFEIADYVIFLFGFTLVWTFFDDEKKGLWCVNYATPGGRMNLALERCGVLLVGNCIFTAALYLLLFGNAFLLYGGVEDMGSSVQSSPLFRDCTLRVSASEYLFLFVLLHAAMSFAMSLFVWMVLLFFRNHLLSMALLLFILGAEGALSAVLPEQSIFVVLKYENLFRLIHPGDILYSYRNYNLFSHPVNCFHACLCLIFTTILIGAAVSVGIASCRRPIAGEGKAEAVIARWQTKANEVYHRGLSHLSVLGMEFYKVFIMQKGGLFLIVWLYLLVGGIDTGSVFYLGTGAVLKDIYKEYSGPDDGRLRSYVEKQESILLMEKTRYEKMAEAYKAGAVSKEKLENASLHYSSFSTLESSIDSVNMQLAYMERVRKERGIPVWFLSNKGYKILWTGDGLYLGQGYGEQEQRGLLAVIVLTLLLSTVFSYDRTCGMEKMLRATPYGREKLFYIKIFMAFLCCLVICLTTYGLELYEVQRLYPVNCLEAPIQSLDFMEDFPFPISIGTFLVSVEMIHLVVLFAIGMVVCACSVYWKDAKGTIAALVIFIFPAALQMSGIGWCEYISVLQPLVYIEALQEHGFIYSAGIVLVMLGIGAVCYQMVKKRWCRTGRDG